MASDQPVSDSYRELERYLEQAQEEIGRAFDDLTLHERNYREEKLENLFLEGLDPSVSFIYTNETGKYRKWERKLSCPSSPEYPTRSPELYRSRGQRGHSRPTVTLSDDCVFYSDFRNGYLDKKCESVELGDISKTEYFPHNLYQSQCITLNQVLKQLLCSYLKTGLLTIPVKKPEVFIPSPPSGENVKLLSDWADNLVKEIDETLSFRDHEGTQDLHFSPVRNSCNHYFREKTTHKDSVYSNVTREPWCCTPDSSDICKYRAKYSFRNRCLGKSRETRQNSYPVKMEEVDTLHSNSKTRLSSCPSRKSYGQSDSKLTCETAIQTNDDGYVTQRTGGVTIPSDNFSQKLRTEIGVQTSDDSYLIQRTGGVTIPSDNFSQKLRTEFGVPACLGNVATSTCKSSVTKFPFIRNQNEHSDLAPKVPVKTLVTTNELDQETQTLVYSQLVEANDKHIFLQSVSEVGDGRNTKGADIQSQTDSDLEQSSVRGSDFIIVSSEEQFKEDDRTKICYNSISSPTMIKIPAMSRSSGEIETIQDLAQLVKERSKSDSAVTGERVSPHNQYIYPLAPKSETRLTYDETAAFCSKFDSINLKNQINYNIELKRKDVSSDDVILNLDKLSSTDSWKSAEQEPTERDYLTGADAISSSADAISSCDDTDQESQLLDVLEYKEEFLVTKASPDDDDPSQNLKWDFCRTSTNEGEKSVGFTEIRNNGSKSLHEGDMIQKTDTYSEFLRGRCITDGPESSDSQQMTILNGKVYENTLEPTCSFSHIAADHLGSLSTVPAQLSRYDLEDFMRKVENCAYQPPPNDQLENHIDNTSANGTWPPTGRQLELQDAVTQTTPRASRSSSYTQMTVCDIRGLGNLSQTQAGSNLSKGSPFSLSSSSISEFLSSVSTSSPIRSSDGDSDEVPGFKTNYCKFEEQVKSTSGLTLSKYSSQSEHGCRLCQNLTFNQSTTGPSVSVSPAEKGELRVPHSKFNHTSVYPDKNYCGSEFQLEKVKGIGNNATNLKEECYQTSSHEATKYIDSRNTVQEIRPSDCVQTLPEKTDSNGYHSERRANTGDRSTQPSARAKIFLREISFKSSSAPLLRPQPNSSITNSPNAPSDVTCVTAVEENK
ncbi:uncharacterized protein LOC143251883 [Tachypleus tridentatus]|uniref:uncharacterized protein LOC143251883 n=1 Tax=Tachypleus tridentatus TaxID=6853 RepID=UPI003FD6B599